MTDDVPDDFMTEERAVIAGLSSYARELFPGRVDEWTDRTGLPGFTIRRGTWPKVVSVNTDQWIHVQVGRATGSWTATMRARRWRGAYFSE